MDIKDFRLQRISIRCDFPNSPLFWAASAVVVNSHLAKYNDWTRTASGFWLASEDQKLRVRLLPNLILAELESFPNDSKDATEVYTTFFSNTKQLMFDALNKYGYKGVTDAEITLRYIIAVEDIPALVSKNIDSHVLGNDIFQKQKHGTPVDLGWYGGLSYGKDFWRSFYAYTMYKSDLEDYFPLSHDELEEKGLVVSIYLGKPNDNKEFSIDSLLKLLDVPFKDHNEFANSIIHTLKD